MVPIKIKCPICSAVKDVNTKRKFIVCPQCHTQLQFPGFQYANIDWHSGQYASIEWWNDCPACGSPNMYLDPKTETVWLCPDCNLRWQKKDEEEGVLWFCDSCETLMNIQSGFNTSSGVWRCSECGFLNDVTENNIDSETEEEDILYPYVTLSDGTEIAYSGQIYDQGKAYTRVDIKKPYTRGFIKASCIIPGRIWSFEAMDEDEINELFEFMDNKDDNILQLSKMRTQT